MEITVVKYRRSESGGLLTHNGTFSVVEGGIVLYHSHLSQSYIPFNRIVTIDQTFTEAVPTGERLDKSLANRFRRN